MRLDTYTGSRVGVNVNGPLSFYCARCGTRVSPPKNHAKGTKSLCRDCRYVDPKFFERNR